MDAKVAKLIGEYEKRIKIDQEWLRKNQEANKKARKNKNVAMQEEYAVERLELNTRIQALVQAKHDIKGLLDAKEVCQETDS